MKYIIQNAHLVDPANRIDAACDIYIADGVIQGVNQSPKNFADKTTKQINAKGCFVFPGLVDLCARLREPGEEHKATIDSETRAALGGGITTLVCPPDTSPVIDTPAMVHMVKNRARAGNGAKVIPQGALSVGLAGEQLSNIAMLMDAGCAGVGNALQPMENTLVMRRALQYASTYDAVVFIAPQDAWLVGNGSVHEGEVSARLGLPAIPEAAESVGAARDIALIETSGARAHFDMLSSARTVEMVAEAKRRNLPLTAGVSLHHLLLDENAIGAFNAQCKVFPPLRTAADRGALLAGLQQGVLSVICSDHQPHTDDDKLAPFSEAAAGISSLDGMLALAWELVTRGDLERDTAIAAMTCNPARVIRRDIGHLAAGAVADLCIFNPDIRWKLTPEAMQSRGKNTPFQDRELHGKVTHTWLNGELKFEA